MAKYEKIQVGIPTDNDWSLEDIEAKAEKVGMDKNQFVLMAVDMLYNFDELVFDYIEKYNKNLGVPKHVIVQNPILEQCAIEEVEKMAYKALGRKRPLKLLKQFMQVEDDEGIRIITGKEYFDLVKYDKRKEIKKQIEDAERRLEYLKTKNIDNE